MAGHLTVKEVLVEGAACRAAIRAVQDAVAATTAEVGCLRLADSPGRIEREAWEDLKGVQ